MSLCLSTGLLMVLYKHRMWCAQCLIQDVFHWNPSWNINLFWPYAVKRMDRDRKRSYSHCLVQTSLETCLRQVFSFQLFSMKSPCSIFQVNLSFWQNDVCNKYRLKKLHSCLVYKLPLPCNSTTFNLPSLKLKCFVRKRIPCTGIF